jgi:hypothetical protein
MALWRAPVDFGFGTISVAAAIGDTTLTSTSFASLPSNFSTSNVCPLNLINPSTGAREVVWITGHTAASTTVTVIRGKEGTSAAAWASGSQWVCAPTASRDGVPLMTTAQINALTDQHVGMRVLNTDTSAIWEWTFSAGWQDEIGLAKPSDFGLTAAGGSLPTSANLLVRSGNVLSATPSAGLVAVTFATAFPNGYFGAMAGSIAGGLFVGAVSCESGTTTGMNLRPVQYSGSAPSTCSLFYLALGW